MKKVAGIFILITVFLCVSCKKERQDGFPYILVNAGFSLQDPEFNVLKTPGKAVEVPEDVYGKHGVGGLILFNSSGVIMAYDKRSPASLAEECNVRLNSTITCIDDCSGTIFQLSDGSRISGQGGLPLVRYNVIINGSLSLGTGTIRVTN